MGNGSLKIKVNADGETKLVNVAKVTATIGSAVHADVRLLHPSVKPEHARLWLEGGRLWLQDLGAGAGTFLNGTRLPILKPMLVRPLDVLTVGECADALTFEKSDVAPAMRAPRVTGEAPLNESTLTDVRPSPLLPAIDPGLSAAREERARLARDLAEMRLQLQMAELEKSGVDELRRQVNDLRAEMRTLADDRRAFDQSSARAREAEAARTRQHEIDLKQKREHAERELASLRDMRGRDLGRWKVDVVADLNAQVHGLLLEKVRAWVTRPFSQDMTFELEGELASLFSGLLLEEDPHGGAVGAATRALAPPPAPTTVRAISDEGSSIRIALEHTVARRPGSLTKRVVTSGLSVAVLALGVEAYRLSHQDSATQTSLRQPAAVTSTWRPARDRNLRDTYVENVLYTDGYLELTLSDQWRRAWTTALAEGAGTWGIDPAVITAAAVREVEAITDLRYLRDHAIAGREDEALRAMRAREQRLRGDLLGLFKRDQSIVARYVTLERGVLVRLLPH